MRRWTFWAFVAVFILTLNTFYWGWIFPDGVAPLLGHWPKTGALGAVLTNLFLVNMKSAPVDVSKPLAWVILGEMIVSYILVSMDIRLRRMGTHGTAGPARWKTTRRYRSRGFAFAGVGSMPRAKARPRVVMPGRRARPASIQPRRWFSFGEKEQRLLLGRYKGWTVSLSQRQQTENALLTAPIGAGKTVLIILRNLLREIGLRSLFVADVKAELVRLAAGWLSRHYTVWVFSPGRAARSNGYNPLDHVQSIRDAQNLADCWIANTGESKHGDFWAKATRRLFVAAILHLRTAEPRAAFSRMADIFTRMSYNEMRNLLSKSPHPDARGEALSAFDAMDKNERMAGAILAELGTRFDVMMDADVRKTTSYNDIDFARMAEQPIALFLSIPPRDRQRFHPLMACFTMQMFSAWEARAEDEPEGQLPLPVQCYLDEFANLGNIYGLSDHLTTIRHIGVGLLIVLQSFSQLDERYGVAIRKTVLTNCTTHLLLPGSGLDECEYYSARIGDTTVEATSRTSTPSGLFPSMPNITSNEVKRRLFNGDELRTMDEGTMMVLGSSSQVMMVKTKPWFKDRETRDRAKLPMVQATDLEDEATNSTPYGSLAGANFPSSGGFVGNTGPVVDADQDDEDDGLAPE